MEGKVAVIGSSDFVMPFSALGVDTFAVGETPQEIAESAKQVADQGYGLVVVAENIASAVDEVFAGYQQSPTPCIVVVPFTTQSEGFATKALGEVLKMATGINIMQDN
ncbi:MAG: hypothetical protein JXN61_07380 [Sedimentisphaerales bacterium]|nr:hypothetical protein [Sedimentisphaerales bacterium]